MAFSVHSNGAWSHWVWLLDHQHRLVLDSIDDANGSSDETEDPIIPHEQHHEERGHDNRHDEHDADNQDNCVDDGVDHDNHLNSEEIGAFPLKYREDSEYVADHGEDRPEIKASRYDDGSGMVMRIMVNGRCGFK